MKSREYSNHRDQLALASPPKNRLRNIADALLSAFEDKIEYRSTGYVLFDQVTVEDLAHAFRRYPIIIKSLLSLANVAGRAIKRDLNTTIDTYGPTIASEKAAALAGYLKPMLPKEIAIPAILELDRYSWTDKEMRSAKGRWEKLILRSLNNNSERIYKKRKFQVDGESFELDAATPPTGKEIKIGVDVKRIEARQDIHKRSDEIINKARKFKKAHPTGLFYAVVYYPFPSEHSNVLSRLKSSNIEGVFFATESPSTIEQTAKHLVGSSAQVLSGD